MSRAHYRLAVGAAEIFSAAGSGGPVEVRVHDDALLVVGPDSSDRVSFAFVAAVTSADYAVTVELAGRPPMTLRRLGRRSDEFADLLTTRLRECARLLTSALAAQIPHDVGWQDRISQLLSGAEGNP